MKKLMLALLTATFVLSFAACNTVEGIGKDIKKGGQAIEKAAK